MTPSLLVSGSSSMCIAVTSHRMMAGADDPLSTQKGSTLDAHFGGRPNPFIHRDPGAEDGALMEPSGRNRWQPVANGTPSKTSQTSRSATGGNPRRPFRSAWKGGGQRFETLRGLP